MHMIPDEGATTQPTEVFRLDIFTGETETDSVIFNSTEAGVDAEALRIVTAQGGDHGDVYQLTGGDRAIYYTSVTVK